MEKTLIINMSDYAFKDIVTENSLEGIIIIQNKGVGSIEILESLKTDIPNNTAKGITLKPYEKYTYKVKSNKGLFIKSSSHGSKTKISVTGIS